MEAYIFDGTDLASRNLAARQRKEILSRMSGQQKFIIDLRNVQSVSESFADELFGVMVLEKGSKFVTTNVKIVNASDSVLRSIAIAIQRRADQAKRESLH